MSEKEKLLTLSAVKKEHGFSERLVQELLGEPDATKPNPYWKAGAPMRLYDPARVEAAKKRREWKAYQPTRARRKAAGRKVSDEKRTETKEWAETVNIRFKKRTPKNVQGARKSGFEHWAKMQYADDPYFAKPRFKDIDGETLDRWAVNCLRHKFMDYDKRLFETFGKTGAREAYAIIRRRCLDMIAERFPAFAAECEEQALDQYEAE